MKPSATNSASTATQEGLVKYAGAQRDIFTTGKAEASVAVAEMAQGSGCYGLGAVAALDGEITVLAGKPFVARVRGGTCTVDYGVAHSAAFAVWTEQANWRDESVPEDIVGYVDVQRFVKARASAAGLDVTQPFPFRLVGTPKEVKWHINVDRTGGKPITPDLFAESKANYVARHHAMEIVGFYSERHGGVFISAYAPAVKTESGVRNAMHIHFVARDGTATGHIDDLVLDGGMRLLLPGQNQ
jgi:alpha-acetolactate decarboxylase